MSHITKNFKNNITSEPLLWEWSQNSDGENPVKIRITYKRKRKYYSVKFNGKNLFASKEKWVQVQDHSIRLRGLMKEMRLAVIEAIRGAESAVALTIRNNRPFTFDRFEKEYLSQDSELGFLGLFESHINSIKEEERIGTFRSYNNALQAFKKFRNNKEIDPIDVTPDLLKKFEQFLSSPRKEILSNGKVIEHTAKRSTIAIYLRTIRVIYNVAISRNGSLIEFYPFSSKRADKNKFRIKGGAGKKGEALSIEQLKKFISVPTQMGLPQFEAKSIWLFSFFAQGMNFRDICLLKRENIQGGVINYVRSKTKNSEGSEEKMQIPLSQELRSIIDGLEKHDGDYIFRFLKTGVSPEVQDSLVQQNLKTINKWLKKMCDKNGLPPITTYWARHSYANCLKQAGIPPELIRELLGHSDLRTTDVYLKRFDLEKREAANSQIFATLKVA